MIKKKIIFAQTNNFEYSYFFAHLSALINLVIMHAVFNAIF